MLERTLRLCRPFMLCFFFFSCSLFLWGELERWHASPKVTQVVCARISKRFSWPWGSDSLLWSLLGGLSIWPSVRRGRIWPYGLKTSICICLWKMSKIHSCSISSLPFHFSLSAKLCLETFSIFTNSLNLKLPFIWMNTLWLGPCTSAPSL